MGKISNVSVEVGPLGRMATSGQFCELQNCQHFSPYVGNMSANRQI